MTDDSLESSSDLLVKALSDEEGETRYNASRSLFKRWGKGRDVGLLVELMKSDNIHHRSMAAYFLWEAEPPPSPELFEIVLTWADDPISECRRRFVTYVLDNQIYDDMVADRLANCLYDWDLGVRFEVIDWATRVTNEVFESFSHLIDSGAGVKESRLRGERGRLLEDYTKKRGIRAIEIVRRLRAGEEIEAIRNSTPGEDSSIFDRLLWRQRAETD